MNSILRDLRNIKKLAVSVGFKSDTQKEDRDLEMQNLRQSFQHK